MMNNNQSYPAQQMQQNNNMNFFNGMQNMNGNMGMSMQQQTQQPNFGMAPMGGAPSNLTVMGGEGMNSPPYGKKDEQTSKMAFDFMGDSPSGVSNNGSGNPQINQFASFGSFR